MRNVVCFVFLVCVTLLVAPVNADDPPKLKLLPVCWDGRLTGLHVEANKAGKWELTFPKALCNYHI